MSNDSYESNEKQSLHGEAVNWMDASSRSLPFVQRALKKYEYVTSVDQPPYESSGRLPPSIPNATSWRTEMQWLMEEKLEWIGMKDVAEPSKPLIPPNPCVRFVSSGS